MDCDSDERFECNDEGGKRAFPFGDAAGDRESKRVATKVNIDDAPWPPADWGEFGIQDAEGQLGGLTGELPAPYMDVLGTDWMAWQHFDAFGESFEPAVPEGQTSQLPFTPFSGVPVLQEQGVGLSDWDDARQDDRLLGAAVKAKSGSTSVAGFSGVHSRVLSRSPFGQEASASEAAGETSSRHDSADGGVDNDGTSHMEVDRAPLTKDIYQQVHDACFGVVLVSAALLTSSTLKVTPDAPPLIVRTSGNIIRLYDENEKVAGLLISDGLSSLVEKFSVRLTASFTPEPQAYSTKMPVDKSRKARTLKPPKNKGLTRMVVYGFMADKDAIGRHLSKAMLYLQHPRLVEYDQSVEYFNPHLLLRPGAKMPRIEDLHLDMGKESTPGPTALDEVKG